MEKFKIYENKSIRLSDYDYSLSGGYFVTICVKDREEIFGHIQHGEMRLNGFGSIAKKFLQDIPNHFVDVVLDEFVVMPNHIHAILVICGDAIVGQRHAFDTINRKHEKLPVIVGSFKSAVTKEINLHFSDANFKWQTSYHDHIIRNQKALQNIRQYIISNPENWGEDLENEIFVSKTPEDERKEKLKKFYSSLCEQ